MNETRNPLGYLNDWKPYRETQILLGRVESVLEEYKDHLPLTCRQIYYRMIAEWSYPKGKPFERKLYDLLVNARRARMIDFDDIRDDGIMGAGNGGWENPEHQWDAIESSLRGYTRDRQIDQPKRLEVWCEAAGMVPQLAKVAADYSIPVYSSGGFNSLTAIRQIADHCAQDGRDTSILHLGDYDPSGMSIFERVRDDVRAFLEFDAPEVDFQAVRVALVGHFMDYAGEVPTPDGENHIEEHDLPMDPITTNDGRSQTWKKQGRTQKCELEALAPNVVADVLREAIEARVDHDALEETERREAHEKTGMWMLRGVPDLEIRPGTDLANGRNGHQLGDLARLPIDLDWSGS